MPGLTLITWNTAAKSVRQEPLESLQMFGTRFFRDIFLNEAKVSLFADRYQQYPVKRLELDSGFIILEGVMNDRSDEDLRAIGAKVVELIRHGESLRLLGDWLAKTDGDFVLVVVDSITSTVVLANDRLGRLPVYVAKHDDGWIVSREIGTVLDTVQQVEMDASGCAEMVAFRWPLGNKTIYRNIEALDPATILQNNWTSYGSLKSNHYYDFSFDHRISVSNSRLAYDRCTELFLQAIARRLKNRPEMPAMVGLSGGMDSRVIAGGLRFSGKQFQSVSFKYRDNARNPDWVAAGRLAQSVQSEFRSYDLDGTTSAPGDKLLKLKRGLNFTGVGFIVRFLDEVVADWGYDYDYWTGDGGNRPLVEPGSMLKFKTVDDLVVYLHKEYNFTAFAAIEKQFGLKQGAIEESLRSILESFPERNINYKFERFIFSQRMRRWLFEGEDRNRYYFWQQSPLFDRDFVDYSMSLDSGLKRDKRLYRAMILKMWKPAAEVVYTGLNLPLTSPLFPIKARLSRSPTVRRIRGYMKGVKQPVPGEYEEVQMQNLQSLERLKTVN